MASPEKSLSGKRSKPKSKAKKSGKKKLRHIHIEPADNGGFNVSHQLEGEPDENGMPSSETQTHALGGPDDLLSHIQNTVGGQLPPAGAAGPGAGPAPGGM